MHEENVYFEAHFVLLYVKYAVFKQRQSCKNSLILNRTHMLFIIKYLNIAMKIQHIIHTLMSAQFSYQQSFNK